MNPSPQGSMDFLAALYSEGGGALCLDLCQGWLLEESSLVN